MDGKQRIKIMENIISIKAKTVKYLNEKKIKGLILSK